MSRHRRSRSRPRVRLTLPAAVTVGLLGSGLLVWQSTYAAFTATTTTPTSSFGSGKVEISNNTGGTALFTVTNLVPNSTDTRCVDVTYSGTVASSVKLYAAYNTANALAQYLTFQVDQIGATATCDATAATVSTIYGGTTAQTLAGLVGTATSYTSGLGTWTPATTATQRYRFQYLLQDNNAAQNLSAQVNFTWEARSTGA